MSIDQRFTSLHRASVALVALVACWAPSVSAAGPVASMRVADARPLTPGVWGGDHIRMEIGGDGARLEYDCARGTIDQSIVLDAGGRFTAKGTYAPDHHGPRRNSDPAAARARYVGRVTGETMTLTVTLEAGAQRVGRFTLTRGTDPLLTKCG